MARKVRISIKLPMTIVALCCVAVGAMGYLAVGAAYEILEKQGRSRLSSITDAQTASLTASLETLRRSVLSQSISPVFRSTMTAFIGAFEAIPGEKSAYLRQRYVDDNEHPYGQKQLTDFVEGRDAYNRAHRKSHPYFRSLLENNNYADFYLLDEYGNILYSVMKKEEFAKNVLEGEFADLGLSRIFERITTSETETPNFVFEDFSDYPLRDKPYSAFMGSPILASNGAILGVFAIRLEPSALSGSNLMAQNLGETGVVFTVGSDHRTRLWTGSEHTNGISTEQGFSYKQVGENDPVARSFAEGDGVMTGVSADGHNSISVFRKLQFSGATWAIVAQQETDELFHDANALGRSILTQGTVLVLIAALIAYFVSRGLTHPLEQVRKSVTQVAMGDLDANIPSMARGDEIGEISIALDTFRQSLLSAKVAETRANMLGAALEATSASLMIVDTDFTVVHANEAASEFLDKYIDCHPEQQSGRSASCGSENIREMLGKNIETAKRVSLGEIKETSIDFADEDNRITLVMRTFVQAGAARGAVVEWIDRTEELRKTALLKSIEQRQCLIEFDRNGQVTDINDKVCSMIESGRTTIIGLNVEDVIVLKPEKIDHPDGFWAGVLAHGAAWGQFQIRSGQENPIWIDGGLTVVTDDRDEPLSVVMIGNDVSHARENLDRAKRDQERIAQEQRVIVAELGENLDRLAKGDLTVSIQLGIDGDYEQLKCDFNSAVQRLHETMTGLVVSCDAIDVGAQGIASSGDDLLQRTKDQSATLEKTADEISELTKSVAEAAIRSQSISTMVSETRQDASASSSVMGDAVLAMSEIEKSSAAISNITKLIEEIAFQTNLLALNAGVEAARAGDAGRGFAVVATEVRALSQRSSEAASDINSVIAEATRQITHGAALVTKAGNSVDDILEKVSEIATHIVEIAKSSTHQSTSLSHIDMAVRGLDDVNKHNATLLSETTLAGKTLREESGGLVSASSKFILNRTENEADQISNIIETAPDSDAATQSPLAQDQAEQPSNLILSA